MNASPLDFLWGTILERVDLDVVRHVLLLTIRVSSASGDTVHTLKCTDLSELRFFSSIPRPWEYAEVTEIHSNVTASGAIQIEILLWSEEAGLVALADSVTLDDRPIIRTASNS